MFKCNYGHSCSSDNNTTSNNDNIEDNDDDDDGSRRAAECRITNRILEPNAERWPTTVQWNEMEKFSIFCWQFKLIWNKVTNDSDSEPSERLCYRLLSIKW